MNVRSFLAAGACVLVAAGLLLGFSELGTPAHNRLAALDHHRLDQMTSIAQRLLGSVDAPSRKPTTYGYGDADSTNGVEYRRTGKRSYRLCTTFALTGANDSHDFAERQFPHPAGRSCYDLITTATDPVRGPIPASPVPTGAP